MPHHRPNPKRAKSRRKRDVEIIMEPQSRSLDFRQANARVNALRTSTSSASIPKTPTLGSSSSETTEYTPIQRGASIASIPSTPAAATVAQPTPQPAAPVPSTPVLTAPTPQPVAPPQAVPSDAVATLADGVDPATLPVVPAPPSHPAIDPTAMGTMDGRAIIDVDLSAMTDKAWRRPGSDISDWFNYGFDELSWEAYCYRRRDLGELANVLKTNVLNFSGLTEDQLTALPPDARTMVMTGTQAMMNGAPGMLGMMDMMPMGMPINGEMAIMAMQDGGGGATPDQGAMQDAFVGNPSMMGMGMEDAAPTGPGMARGAAPYRGTRGLRGARGFVGRGRGRGGYDAPPVPVRPTSPLPPNVPTGPRNQNKYKDKDRDGAAAVDAAVRKRRMSPSLEDRRDSKRR
ncbi:Fip1-domain-containing protein [Mycena amicta]|nr:Fip1-domain-containing protein [Mycena amicta]